MEIMICDCPDEVAEGSPEVKLSHQIFDLELVQGILSQAKGGFSSTKQKDLAWVGVQSGVQSSNWLAGMPKKG